MYNKLGKEWIAKRLNKSYPWAKMNSIDYSPFYFIDTANKKVITQESGMSHDQFLKQRDKLKSKNNIISLDIEKGEWNTLGEAKDSSYRIYATLPWGVYVDLYYLIDFKNNRILKLSENLTNILHGLINRSIGDHELDLTFCIDSTVYFGNYANKIDSFTISRSELIDTGQTFYENIEENSNLKNPVNPLFATIFIAAFLFTSFLILKRKKIYPFNLKPNLEPLPNDTITKEQISPNYKSIQVHDILNENERLLLKMIFYNSREKRLTTIDEINICLGISKRSIEIQKRNRSIIISSINEKLGILKGEKKPIIDKLRSDFDKRSYEYFILESNFDFIENILAVK
jgi:hypothetical protein